MRHLRKILILVAAGMPLLSSSLALAKIARNTIDPVAAFSDQGRRIEVTGPIECSEREWVDLRVTVTQRSRGEVAEGHARITCTPEEQTWSVIATTQGPEIFEPGPATAVAVATSSLRGKSSDAHQWLVNVTLQEEGPR